MNYKILTDPLKRDLENSNGDYEIQSHLDFETPNGRYRVPEFTIANGASIPLLAQFFIPKSGKWNRCATVHDSGFEDGGYIRLIEIDGKWYEDNFEEMTQFEVNEIYRGLMESRDVKKWREKAQYYTLNCFGWWTWYKYRNEDN